jgi:AraC-like DNA-binding protein
MRMDQVLSPSVVFESRGMPATAAIEAWQEIAGNTLRIGIDQDDRPRFSLSLQAMRLDETVVTAAETTAQSLHRDLGRVQRDGLDQYGFFLQVAGSRLVRANGVDSALMPGDLQFVDMAQEDCSIATDGRTTTLYVPRDLVEADVPEAWRLHGTIIRNTAAQIFANQLLTLFDRNCAWSPVMAGFLERSLLSIAFGCLVESQTNEPPFAPDHLARSIRRRIEQYIDDNLADHELGAQAIGQEFGVSRSVIYRVFQVHGGLNRYILGCRLRRVRRLLQEGNERTIAELAFASGFVSPAHFNREFRRAFGVTPTDVRNRPWRASPDPVEPSSLDQLFRSLAP